MQKIGKEVIAIDFGGTNLRTALVRNYKIINLIRKKTPATKEGILIEMINSVSELMNKNIGGIGIASPGPLKNGIIINPPNIPFRNFDMKKYFEKRFRIKVEVENDAKCAALAEFKLGAGKGKKNFFILTLGTGIGGGVFIDGKLFNAGDIGAELGSSYLYEGKTFEELAGGVSVREKSRKYLGNEFNISDLIKMKNQEAKEIVDETSEYLGRGIGSLINVFNPEIVVLAGGMRVGGDKFLKQIREKTKKYILLPGDYNIVWSKLEEPGVLGAALLFD